MDKLAAPPDKIEFAKQYIDLLRTNDLDGIKAKLAPNLITPTIDSTLTKITAHFPKSTPISVKLVGSNTNISTFNSITSSVYDITFEYQFSQTEWALANVVMQEKANDLLVIGFTITPSNNSLLHNSKFEFFGQPLQSYLFLALAFAIMAFQLYALALCIKTPIKKRKWLWLIIIFISIVNMRYNWSNHLIYFDDVKHGNGTTSFNFIGVNFPPVSFVKAYYQPFFIIFRLPLGAIIFLARYRKIKRKSEAPLATIT